jgi:glutamate-1-semialdehyde 2,1-aminomutase
MQRPNIDLDTAIADVESRYITANPKSRERFESARGVMPVGNTRTTLHYDPFPVTLVRGEGARLHDLDGHEYIDFIGEYTAGLYGHSEPAIIAAIKEALECGLVLGGPNLYEARLAELMCQRFPAVEQVRFCNSGTEANIMNLCLSRVVTKRAAIMAFNGGYHGGVLAFAGGGSPINAPFETVIGSYNEVEATRELMAQNAGHLAAVIVEPMTGAGGCIEASLEFLTMLREETARHGIVLIFDEVMTSRLAPGGLHEATGVMPDLVSFGKYLGGGVSFGAFGGRAELMAVLDPTSPTGLPHSGTYNNNVLTMAAGIAGLEKVYTPEAVRRLNGTGDRLRQDLQGIAVAMDVPLTVCGRGSMLCIHFLRGPIRNPVEATKASAAARKLFHLDMNLRGFYMARRGFMALCLPLTDADYAAFRDAFKDFLAENRATVIAAIEGAAGGQRPG